jgi:hypothetical protein
VAFSGSRQRVSAPGGTPFDRSRLGSDEQPAQQQEGETSAPIVANRLLPKELPAAATGHPAWTLRVILNCEISNQIFTMPADAG